jgi:hypothetical protein
MVIITQNEVIIIIKIIINFTLISLTDFSLRRIRFIYPDANSNKKGGNYAHFFVHNSKHDKLCNISFWGTFGFRKGGDFLTSCRTS